MIKSFRDLRIWREAHALAVEIYLVTEHFPTSERYGLSSQMRRAASSISANIAEGMGKATRKDFLNYLYVSRGSTQEIINFCLLTSDLGYLSKEKGNQLIARYDGLSAGIQKMISSIKSKDTNDLAT